MTMRAAGIWLIPLLWPHRCGAGWTCLRLDLGTPVEYRLGSADSQFPLCLQVPHHASARGVVVEAQVDDLHGQPARVCLRGEFIINARSPSSSLKELVNCSEGRVSLPLLQPMATMSYVIKPSITTAAHSPRLRIAAQYQLAGDAPRAPPPPSPPSSAHRGYCRPAESAFMAICADDRERLCPGATNPEMVMKFFDEDREHVSPDCLEAMHKLSECLYGPQLLVPMEIASFLLLATASVVLFCTLLRCCCRYVCATTRGGDAASEASAADEHELTDEDEPTVTPLPTGVTHVTAKPEQRTLVEADADEEEALPTYTEVIDGATKASRT